MKKKKKKKKKNYNVPKLFRHHQRHLNHFQSLPRRRNPGHQHLSKFGGPLLEKATVTVTGSWLPQTTLQRGGHGPLVRCSHTCSYSKEEIKNSPSRLDQNPCSSPHHAAVGEYLSISFSDCVDGVLTLVSVPRRGLSGWCLGSKI
jgi:hypothetical protein